MYERLCWEFLSSLKVDRTTPYQNRPVHIQFRLFNRLFEANLVEFDRRLHLLHGGIWVVGHENLNVQDFWCEITYDQRTLVTNNHGFHVPYSANGSKATSICNPTLRYRHKLIANTIFPIHESQDACNWVYDNDIDVKSDEERAQPQGRAIGGSVGSGGMEDVAGGSGVVPPEEEMYEPPLTRSCTEANSSGFNEAQFY
ncbi:hypothetical protein Cgig2_024404 [Carnegiea gigantea]|uniref:Uncharacterized protein n=1 Tax=Carnegiea gigantea TaxID=171969 RepID=A0A9Q1QJR1_9CARY|nr:hypothetical protein Cgig2_024404 [Carnegiea gigantea]